MYGIVYQAFYHTLGLPKVVQKCWKLYFYKAIFREVPSSASHWQQDLGQNSDEQEVLFCVGGEKDRRANGSFL